MLELPALERLLLWAILILSGLSSVLGYIEIGRQTVRFRRALVAFCTVQITLGAVLLILRAASIQAFPITGVFESMLLMMVFIGITFLFLSAFIQQVWFLSVMAWVLFIMALLAAFVARPAAVLQEAARTPLVILHALSMTLSGAMIVFATAMSVLFLWSRKRLKNKQFSTLFGKMPTIERLETLNLLGLHLSLIALSFGLVSGIGLVAVKSAGLAMTPIDWLTDAKIVLITVAWFLLIGLVVSNRLCAFSGRTIAQSTIILCLLVVFAFVGSTIFCKSSHDFERKPETETTISRIASCRLY